MEKKANNNLLLFSNYKEYFEILEAEEAKELIILLFNFAETHKTAEIDKSKVGLKMAYKSITDNLIFGSLRYINSVENGRKGGRPKNPKKPNQNPEKVKGREEKGKEKKVIEEIVNFVYFKEKNLNDLFLEYLKSRPKSKNTPRSIKMLVKKCDGFKREEIKEALEVAIAGGYQSIFPKKKKETKKLLSDLDIDYSDF